MNYLRQKLGDPECSKGSAVDLACAKIIGQKRHFEEAPLSQRETCPLRCGEMKIVVRQMRVQAQLSRFTPAYMLRRAGFATRPSRSISRSMLFQTFGLGSSMGTSSFAASAI